LQEHKGDTKPEIASKVAQLDIQLIHQVLLNGDGSASLAANEQAQRATPTFEEFRESLQQSTATTREGSPTIIDVNAIVKGAYRDAIVQRMLQGESNNRTTHNPKMLEPVQSLLLELHDRMRHLIPSRNDLHGILRDDAVQQATSMLAILQLTVQAAMALAHLESPVRAETTLEWIQQTNHRDNVSSLQLPQSQSQTGSMNDVRSEENDDDDAVKKKKKDSIFLIDSILYLLLKTELNQVDQHEFYHQNFIIPHILKHGVELERQAFERQFGGKLTDSSTTAPVTRAWIQSLVQQHLTSRSSKGSRNVDDLTSSTTARRELITRGWIEDILFRSSSSLSGSFPLPEIFVQDIDNIRRIRHVTRLAAAGSALALYACQTTGQSTNILQNAIHNDDDDDDDSLSSLDLRRRALLQAMNEPWNNREAYESHVTDAVLALAREFQPSLGETAVATLKSQTPKVLRGEEPVLTLLNRRMQEGFCEMVITCNLHKIMIVPPVMRTGRLTKSTKKNEGTKENQDWFESLQVFSRRGLAFYARDLAMAAQLAGKIVDLAWNIYGDVFLDRLILAALASSSSPQNEHKS